MNKRTKSRLRAPLFIAIDIAFAVALLFIFDVVQWWTIEIGPVRQVGALVGTAVVAGYYRNDWRWYSLMTYYAVYLLNLPYYFGGIATLAMLIALFLLVKDAVKERARARGKSKQVQVSS